MKRSLVSLLGAVAVTTAAGVYATRPDEPRRIARSAYADAQQAMLGGDLEAQFEYMLSAIQADPTYLPAFLDVLTHPAIKYRVGDAVDRLAAAIAIVPDEALRECLSIFVRRFALLEFHTLKREPMTEAAQDCHEAFQLSAWGGDDAGDDRVRRADRLLRKYPEAKETAALLHSALYYSRDTIAIARYGQQFLESSAPVTRAIGYALLRLNARILENPAEVSRIDAEARRALTNRSTMLEYLAWTAQFRETTVDAIKTEVSRLRRLTLLVQRGVAV